MAASTSPAVSHHDRINEVIIQLARDWRLPLKSRDHSWSPSDYQHTSEDYCVEAMKYLYHKDRDALRKAIEEFNENAFWDFAQELAGHQSLVGDYLGGRAGSGDEDCSAMNKIGPNLLKRLQATITFYRRIVRERLSSSLAHRRPRDKDPLQLDQPFDSLVSGPVMTCSTRQQRLEIEATTMLVDDDDEFVTAQESPISLRGSDEDIPEIIPTLVMPLRELIHHDRNVDQSSFVNYPQLPPDPDFSDQCGSVEHAEAAVCSDSAPLQTDIHSHSIADEELGATTPCSEDKPFEIHSGHQLAYKSRRFAECGFEGEQPYQCDGNQILRPERPHFFNILKTGPQAQTQSQSRSWSVDAQVNALPNSGLFVGKELERLIAVPMRVGWVCARAGLQYRCPLSEVIPQNEEQLVNYEALWKHISSIAPPGMPALDVPVTPKAWKAAEDGFKNISLYGSLTFNPDRKGPLFNLRLDPLKEEPDGKSCRFQRVFGGDRILYLTVPSLTQKLPDHLRKQRKRLQLEYQEWLVENKHFLGRTWRVVMIEAKQRKEGARRIDEEGASQQIKLFATHGFGILEPISLEQFFNWFMPMQKNGHIPFSKAFARLELGFSKTYTTITFRPSQIKWMKDDYGDDSKEDTQFNDRTLLWNAYQAECKKERAMNDGCARLSIGAAREIWKSLGKGGAVPSVFQGRIGGAKGVWIVCPPAGEDETDQDIWIEITESQSKFKPHDEDFNDATFDSDRTTFEVLKWSRLPNPSTLNTAIIPILRDRGVPQSTIQEFVWKQLELENSLLSNSLKDGASLLKWVSDKFSVMEHDLKVESLYQGSMPWPLDRRVSAMLKAGFLPQRSFYLASLVEKLAKKWLDRIQEKLNIPVHLSANVLAMADPYHVLKPGEVYLAFSENFVTSEEQFYGPLLHNTDVLLGRYPIRRISDLQKVHAVYKHELAHLRNVIVFPSTGRYPLARKMSNGDYDGDIFWVCWEPSIVGPFRNAPPPVDIAPEKLGFQVDETPLSEVLHCSNVEGFLQKNFQFRCNDNLLGVCSDFHERLAYTENVVSSPRLDYLSDVLDCLVDSPKRGCIFPESSWNRLIKEWDLSNEKYPKRPAYKGSYNEDPQCNRNHILDYLKFEVVRDHATQFLSELKDSLRTAGCHDDDLERLYVSRYHSTLHGSDTRLKAELEHLVDSLTEIVNEWSEMRKRKEDNFIGYSADIEHCYMKYIDIEPKDVSHPVVKEWTRKNLSSAPTTWGLLKASALYAKFTQESRSHFIFVLAGRELLYTKPWQTDSQAVTVVADVLRKMKMKKATTHGVKESEETVADYLDDQRILYGWPRGLDSGEVAFLGDLD